MLYKNVDQEKIGRGLNILQEFDYSFIEKAKYKELTLNTSIFGYDFHGVIDSIVEIDKKLYIVDYKTGKYYDNMMYEVQATIYYILARSNNIPVEDTIIYYYLEENKKVALKPDYNLLFRMCNELVREKEFRKLNFPGNICKYCQLYEECWK